MHDTILHIKNRLIANNEKEWNMKQGQNINYGNSNRDAAK